MKHIVGNEIRLRTELQGLPVIEKITDYGVPLISFILMVEIYSKLVS